MRVAAKTNPTATVVTRCRGTKPRRQKLRTWSWQEESRVIYLHFRSLQLLSGDRITLINMRVVRVFARDDLRWFCRVIDNVPIQIPCIVILSSWIRRVGAAMYLVSACRGDNPISFHVGTIIDVVFTCTNYTLRVFRLGITIFTWFPRVSTMFPWCVAVNGGKSFLTWISHGNINRLSIFWKPRLKKSLLKKKMEFVYVTFINENNKSQPEKNLHLFLISNFMGRYHRHQGLIHSNF